MPLAPPLLELEDTVERILDQQELDQQAVDGQFAHVRAFILESERLFREVEDTLFVEREGAQKMKLCSDEMAHSLDSLNKLQSAVAGRKMFIIKERLRTFLTSRERCLEYFAEFTRLAQKMPIYSPVPAFDAFIKTGLNVLDGRLGKARLEDRFPAIVPELQKAQRMVGLLGLLHQPPPDLLEALKGGIHGLESGFGAVHSFLDSNEKQALDDGLKLIGSSSVILNDQFRAAEEHAKADPRYSRFRPLEEWLRLKNYLAQSPENEVPAAWITETVTQVFYVWDFMLNQAQSLLSEPLLAGAEIENGLTTSLLEECLKYRDMAQANLVSLTGEELLKSDETLWTSHVPYLEKLSDSIDTTFQALEERMLPFKELPGLERIVHLKEEVKKGLADKSLLRDEFTRQLDKVEELIESVRHAQDPVSIEFNNVLPTHRAAFMGMIEDLEDDDWEALDSRWEGVVSTLPHLANLSKNLRGRLSSETSAAKLVKCLRCEHPNSPDRRVCSSCGANLPMVVQKLQTFTEITDPNPGGEAGGGGTISPRAIDLLETLVENVEQSRVSKSEAADAVQLLITDLNRQRQLFTKKLVPIMGKDETLDAYLRFFAQSLGTYFAALMEMHGAAQVASVPRLQAGLLSCRESLDMMDVMKERIDEALRG
jgi:hypothetical protein